MFKLEGSTVTLNGEVVAVPMHMTYKDGSQVKIEDIGWTFSTRLLVDQLFTNLIKLLT